MKIKITNDFQTLTLEEEGHCDMVGLIDRFRKILLAHGFAREEIDKHIVDVSNSGIIVDEDLPF